jgi:predicted DNA-binding mobile mystery protein A
MRHFMRGVANLYMEKDLIPFYRARRIGIPETGWLRQIRQVYGVTVADVARRVGITQQALFRLERAENKGTITLKKLRRVADVLECDVVYALVPRERTLISKAMEIGDRELWRKRIRRKF